MKEENMSYEELNKLKEVDLDIADSEVKDAICCNERMKRIVMNKDVFDGALTFHIIKLRCNTCKKEYLDLDQAEKYDLLLKLEKEELDSFKKKIFA